MLTGNDLRSFRFALALTQREFAAMLGVDAGTVQNWEHRKTTAAITRGLHHMIIKPAHALPAATLHELGVRVSRHLVDGDELEAVACVISAGLTATRGASAAAAPIVQPRKRSQFDSIDMLKRTPSRFVAHAKSATRGAGVGST